VATRVVSLIEHLHRHLIVHRDLRAERVLIDASGHLRLRGLETVVAGAANKWPICSQKVRQGVDISSGAYMAPEYLAAGDGARRVWERRPEDASKILAGIPHDGYSAEGPKRKYTYSADVDWWSLGVLVYEMSEHAHPFGAAPTLEEMYDAHAGVVSPLRRGRSGAQLLGAGLLEWLPEKRLGHRGAKEVMDVSYFREIDWNALGTEGLSQPSPLQDFKLLRDIQRAKANHAKKKRAELNSALTRTTVRSPAPTELDSSRKALAMLDSDEVDTIRPKEAGYATPTELKKWDYISPVALSKEFLGSMAAHTSFL